MKTLTIRQDCPGRWRYSCVYCPGSKSIEIATHRLAIAYAQSHLMRHHKTVDIRFQT